MTRVFGFKNKTNTPGDMGIIPTHKELQCQFTIDFSRCYAIGFICDISKDQTTSIQ